MGYSLYTYFDVSNEITKNQERLQKESYFDIDCKIVIGEYVPEERSKILSKTKIDRSLSKKSQMR